MERKKKIADVFRKVLELAKTHPDVIEKALQVNPKLMSDQPTHVHPSHGKVKSLKSYATDKGTAHTLEIMEGPSKGKWTNALESEMQPIKKEEVCMPEKEFAQEHKRIVSRLGDKDPKALADEKARQEKEMKEHGIKKEEPQAKAPQVPLHHYWNMLNQHDWYHHFSDDMRVHNAGEANERKLSGIAAQSPQHKQMFDQFHAHHFSGEPWKTQRQPKPERPK